MHAAKRPVSLPISGEGVQNKRKKAVSQTATSTSMSPSIGSGSSNNACARDMLHSERPQRVTVFTQYSEINFFRGLPWPPTDAMPYMEVITVDTVPLPHPVLPRSTPSHLKQVYQQCTRAAKMAWISESGLAAFPDDLMTDNHLGKLYKGACRKFVRRQSNPQASATTTSMIAHLSTAHSLLNPTCFVWTDAASQPQRKPSSKL